MDSNVTKKIVSTEKAPKAVGPYSQAVQYKNILYMSGLLGLDKKTMKLVPGGAGPETKQILSNLQAFLEDINISLNNVVKTIIYLKNMDDYSKVSHMYEKSFPNLKHAKTIVPVPKLPLNANVEIEAIIDCRLLIDNNE
uniref:Uncharacterized protein n=1 Tax=Clastoptera arizonana TaxID=38151 RepID=A0A1B6C075_9HEMI